MVRLKNRRRKKKKLLIYKRFRWYVYTDYKFNIIGIGCIEDRKRGVKYFKKIRKYRWLKENAFAIAKH